MVTIQKTNGIDATVVGKVVKPVTSKVAPKSILQQKPKYNLKPAIVSPEKREEIAQRQESAIPQSYIETIKKSFGDHADIFNDVLQVTRDASPRDIRIAYFRRGREILAEGGFRTLDQAATVSDVSTPVRMRFQAVSMAYEIASCLPWKKYVLEHGLEISNDSESVGSDDPVIGSSASLPGSSKPAVRWNGQVEELLFEREPGEDTYSVSDSKKRKKKKTRVFVEAGSLKDHLQKLDNEADEHLVTDFWDTLEESLDGLLKMAGSFDNPTPMEVEDSDTIEAKPSHDSNDSGNDCSVKSDEAPEKEPAHVPFTTPTKEDGRLSSFRPISPDINITRSGSGDVFDFDSISFSGGEGCSHKPSLSTGGQQQLPSRLKKNQNGMLSKEVLQREVRQDPPSLSYKDNDDVFEGLDDNSLVFNGIEDGSSKENPIFAGIVSDSSPAGALGETPDVKSCVDAPKHIALLRVRSESPTNVSELTGTTANTEIPNLSDIVPGGEQQDNLPDEFPDDEIFHPHDEVPRNETPQRDAFDAFEDICERNLESKESVFTALGSLTDSICMRTSVEYDETNNTAARSSDGSINKQAQSDGFVTYLVAYISAIVHDFAGKISEIQWDDSVLGAFMVDDSEIEGMQSTLEKELEKARAIDAVECIKSPSVESIEAVRSFG